MRSDPPVMGVHCDSDVYTPTLALVCFLASSAIFQMK